MNYYLDQEFNEGFRKPLRWLPTIGSFNKPYHFIDLISIGIVCEDGREYYAVCSEFDIRSAYYKHDIEKVRNYGDIRIASEYISWKDYWLRDIVLSPIFFGFYKQGLVNLHSVTEMSLRKMKGVIKNIGKSKKQIKNEIFDFITYKNIPVLIDRKNELNSDQRIQIMGDPVFYGYYADYDWVLFCSLFGTMMDLPNGFPMYCIDLKQILDEKARVYEDHFTNENETFETRLSFIKAKDHYPEQENEHHALADAKWNKKLHEFLKQL